MGRSTKRLYISVLTCVAIVAVAIGLFVLFGMSPYKTIVFKNSEFEDVKLKQGSVIDKLPKMEQEGYVFYGWYYKSDLLEENKVSEGEDIITENIELYPKLERGSFTITFNINGADEGSNTPEPVTEKFETLVNLPVAETVGIYKVDNSLTSVDKKWRKLELKYWSTNSDGSGEHYEQGSQIAIPGKDITLYAHWGRKETKVLFYPNGGAYVNELTIFTGETISADYIKTMAISKPGYHFTNWYQRETITPSDVPYDVSIPVEVAELKLYAQWAPNEYSAKFYADYDTMADPNGTPWRTVAIYHDGFVSDPKADFKAEVKKDGLYFKHWAVGDKNINTPFNFDKKVSWHVQMFAVWTDEVSVENETSADCFKFNESTNTITGLTAKGEALSHIVIPRKINLKDVLAISGVNSNNLISVTLPQTLKDDKDEFGVVKTPAIKEDAFIYCPKLTSFAIAGTLNDYKVVDGVLFNKDGSVLLRYPASKNGASYVVPAETNKIASYAFSKASKLETLECNVATIDMMAFDNATSITTLKLGSKVTNINEHSFREFNSLKFVEIENNNKFIVTAGILYKQETVNGTLVPTTAIKCFNKNQNVTIVLPESVTLIDGYAFQYCSNIEKLEFGAGVIRFGDNCLFGLTGLKEIKFNNPNTTGITIRGELISEKGALEKVWAHENSFIWTELGKKDFLVPLLNPITD